MKAVAPRHPDREHPNPEQKKEEDGPGESLNALIDARHAQMHNASDPSQRRLLSNA